MMMVMMVMVMMMMMVMIVYMIAAKRLQYHKRTKQTTESTFVISRKKGMMHIQLYNI